ncbi:S1 family peptidase [Pantoea septica]|uniref:S1 family peptidase n=1 Tax=Pantoea septica TaxID=472695 RepID=UPI0028A119FF|nr:serine protease [Pantoea septica]
MTSPSKVVHKTTCRIVCDNGLSIGTGFLFTFVHPDNKDLLCPLLVTNKHVINGSKVALVRFNISSQADPNIMFYNLTVESPESAFIMHPDKDVDLCVLPLNDFMKDLEARGFALDAAFFEDNNLNGLEKLTPVEEVFMTGYPNGLWDEKNNKPITRKGITASDVNTDWNGNEEFMIDMACFGGSSGSPVYVMNEGSYVVEGGLAMGTRFILAGILYAGPQVNVNGTVDIINVPTAAVAVANTKVMMNLGIVIKAKKLKDFMPLLGLWN